MNKGLLIVRVVDPEEITKELADEMNKMLDLYSLYLQTGFAYIKKELMIQAYHVHMMDPKISITIEKPYDERN